MPTLRGIVRYAIALVRPQSFDLASAEGRERERNRRVVITAVTSALARSVSLITTLLSVPITLEYLGSERFGLWMTISSFNLLMAFGDLGIGNGVMTAVASASGKDDRVAIREYTASALAALTGVGLLIGAAYLALGHRLPWDDLLNLQSASSGEVNGAIGSFVACFCVRIPAEVVIRVQMGLQVGHRVNLWQLAGSLLGLGGVLAVASGHGGVPWLILASIGIPTLVTLGNAFWFFTVAEPDLRPTLAGTKLVRALEVIRTGGVFFVLQCASALAFASDPMILSTILGPHEVATYSLPAKLFEMPMMVLAFIVTPLWPAYAEARARGDHDWIARTLRGSMQLTAIGAALAGVLLVIIGNAFIRLWVQTDTSYSVWTLSLFAMWMFVRAVGATFAMFLNGFGIVRAQVIVASVHACAAVISKTYSTRFAGIDGLLTASVLSYVLIVVIPYVTMLPRFLFSIRGSARS